jgi:hypothetical protein
MKGVSFKILIEEVTFELTRKEYLECYSQREEEVQRPCGRISPPPQHL